MGKKPGYEEFSRDFETVLKKKNFLSIFGIFSSIFQELA
jgi:hypothetical protein